MVAWIHEPWKGRHQKTTYALGGGTRQRKHFWGQLPPERGQSRQSAVWEHGGRSPTGSCVFESASFLRRIGNAAGRLQNPQRLSVDQGRRDLAPGAPDNAVEGLPRHPHAFRSLGVVEILVVG